MMLRWRIAGLVLATLVAGCGVIYLAGVESIPLTIAGPDWTRPRLEAKGAGWYLPLWMNVLTVACIAFGVFVALRVARRRSHAWSVWAFVSVGLLLTGLAGLLMSFMWVGAEFAMADNVHPTHSVPYNALLPVLSLACLAGSLLAAVCISARRVRLRVR